MNKDIFIFPSNTIKDALKRLTSTSARILLVTDAKEKLLGTLTDGDIRRAILKGKTVNNKIEDAYNKNPHYFFTDNFSIEKAKPLLISEKLELIPILDRKRKIVDCVSYDTLISSEDKFLNIPPLNIPVVIMAGGKGTRLSPFTNILPKALIPLGDKTIAEIIIHEFLKHKIKNYFIILNHRGEMIKAYFNCLKKDYSIRYIHEEDFYGTAGSLKLLDKFIEDNFIVSNCDIIVKANYFDALNFHEENNSCLTLLSSIQTHTIPYGVINFKNGGKVTKIIEKPEYTLPINTGVYILNSSVLKYIPKKEVFQMTDLINILIKHKQNVFTYPVNAEDYIDIGQWEEYRKAIDIFSSKNVP
jgi:dTDP-glucose pyrophosphorylase